jgi:hypothetical protein
MNNPSPTRGFTVQGFGCQAPKSLVDITVTISRRGLEAEMLKPSFDRDRPSYRIVSYRIVSYRSPYKNARRSHDDTRRDTERIRHLCIMWSRYFTIAGGGTFGTISLTVKSTHASGRNHGLPIQ